MKHILKNRTHIFTEFWKDDLKEILTDLTDEIKHLLKDGGKTVNRVKRFNLQDTIDAGADALLIMRVLPGRIKKGFFIFKDEFTEELELQADSKHKTLFTLKVIGALTSFTLGTIYNVRKGTTDFSLKGLRKGNAFTHFIIGELIFRISQAMINRFLNELETHVTDKEELEHIRYFKELLRTRNKDELNQENLAEGDRSIQIVENLKKYIMTGKRGIE